MRNSLKKIFKSIMIDIVKQTIPNELKYYSLEYLNIEVEGSELKKEDFTRFLKLRLKYNKKWRRNHTRQLNKQFNKLTKKCISLHDFMY